MDRKIIDVTMTIENGMITWPGDGPVRVERVRSMDGGGRLNQSRLDLSAHTGTHIDAPVHFIRGARGIDALPLPVLVGPAAVLHLSGMKKIGSGDLQRAGIPQGTKRLLLKTDNCALLERTAFTEDFVHITPEGAQFLIDAGIRLVGIDYLSVAAYGRGEAVHRALLGAGIIIVEGLDLRAVEPGLYKMTALPLRIAGCDGAPARVVLEEVEQEEANGKGRPGTC